MRLAVARRLALAAILAAFAVVFLAPPAFAHARLVEAFPAEGEVLSEGAGQVQLRFSEPVEAAFDPIEVRSEDGERVDLDDARLDPANAEVVVVDLEEDLPAGRYEVEWRVSSEDGHPIDDTYSFVVNRSSGADSPEERTPVEQVGGGGPSEGSATGLGTGAILGIAVVAVIAVAIAARLRSG